MPSEPKDRNFPKKGNKVEAKYPGSTIYYPASVISVYGDHCKVQFDDGSILSVKRSDVMKPNLSTRVLRKRSRSTSGGRTTRSSRSRTRSPVARTKSPERRKTSTPKPEKRNSPSREKSSNSVSRKSAEKQIKSIIKKAEDLTPSTLTKSTSSVTTNSTSQKIVYSEVFEKKDEMKQSTSSGAVHRSSARIAALQLTRSATRTPEPVVLVKRLKAKAFSDDEEEENEDESEEEEEEKVSQKFSYLAFIGTTLKIILLPLVLLFFCFACRKAMCNLLHVPPVYSAWKTFINDITYTLPSCAALHFVLFALSKIPVGRKVKGFPYGSRQTVNTYRLNGIYILLLFLVTFGGCFYYGLYLNWGYDKLRGITVSSLIYSTVWAIATHFIGLCGKTSEEDMKLNKQSGFLGSFFNGHEINPTLCFGEDMKTRFIHFGLMGLVILDLSIMAKAFLMRGFMIPLALTASMHIFFVLDYLVREEVMLSSATYTDDGVGYGFIVAIGSVIPCSFAIQSAYHLSDASKHNHIPHWCSAAIVVMYLCGYFIYLTSSNLKHSFRRNPFSPSLSHVESIPTSRKKRLIVSGLWGIVRHPNYLGLIIMSIASSLPCGFSHALPFTPVVFLAVTLFLRIFSVESLCKEKYGPAWKNYADKVRSRLIPFVF